MKSPRAAVRRASWFVLLAGLLAVSSWPASATDRFFPDYTEHSPDGRYEFTAHSPDNRPGKESPFERHFVYQLRDRTTGKVCWTIRQDDAERADPQYHTLVAISIHTNGWSIATDKGDNLYCFRPDGVKTGEIDFLHSALPKSEFKKYVHKTPAGLVLAPFIDTRFIEAGGRLYYGLRLWWGRYIVIDVAQGKCVPFSGEVRDKWLTLLRQDTMRMLQRGAADLPELEKYPSERELSLDTSKSIYLAGALQMREALPLLRRLEPSKGISDMTIDSYGKAPISSGLVELDDYATLKVRRVVHLALRRLGEKPIVFPVVSPFIASAKAHDNDSLQITPPITPFPRDQRVAGIRRGLSPEEVVNQISGPDYVGSDSARRMTWEYDIDSSRPYTLVLHWKDRHIEAIDRIRPARWQRGDVRDDQIASS